MFVLCLMCVLMMVFSHVLRKDWHLLFKKYLYHQDESVQSAVSANLTRRFFPPMVRLNPLIEHPQIVVQDGRKESLWMEGPYWQHIPPLFTYVPLPFFALDKQITVEVRRLSYALVMLLTGLIFIFTVYAFEKTITAAVSATLATILWIYTPYSRDLFTSVYFGISNIVLAFTVICSFSVVCWYLSQPVGLRKKYSYPRLIFMALVVALPIMTKNVLGAIPSATFFTLLLYDHRKINLKLMVPLAAFLAFLVSYYGPLYVSSPETFRVEILLSFKIFASNFEGWRRPWHFFVSYYLPQFYLRNFWYLYVFAVLAGILVLITGGCKGKSRTILSLSIIWFLWNLLAVTLSVAKAPDFIYQSYLLSLFFGIHSLLLIAVSSAAFEPLRSKLKKTLPAKISLYLAVGLLAGLVFFTARAYGGLINGIAETRSQSYNYETQYEKFYRFGEIARDNGANTRDIFILDATKEDYYFRYYILFHTGAEAVTITEIMPLELDPDYLKTKYERAFFVFDQTRPFPDFLTAYQSFACPDFTVISVDLDSPDFARICRELTVFINQASENKNTLDLYELKNNYAFIKVIAPALYQDLEKKCKKSLSDRPAPYAVKEKFSLVDYRCRKLESLKYKFDFLFRVNQPFEREWNMCLLGYVKEQHLYYLSEEERKSQSKLWWLEPIPPVHDWPADEYIMITEIIEAAPIAYNLKVGFYNPGENSADMVDLGWVDLAALAPAPSMSPRENITTSPPKSNINEDLHGQRQQHGRL